MKPSIYRISLDVHDAHSSVCLDMKRQDTARQINITLTDGGFPYQISEECYAVFSATKADGKRLLHHCEIHNNTIQYIVRAQTTAAVGLMECEIKLYGANDKLLFSPGFNIQVSENALTDEDDLVSEDEVDELTHLISEASKVIAEGKEVNAESRELIDDMEAKRETLDQQIQETKTASANATRHAILAEQASESASNSASNAFNLARDALTAAGNAKTSEDNAKVSAQTAVNMANAAAGHQSSAEKAASDALTHANEAKQSAISAKNMFGQASGCATAAANSAQEAKESEEAARRYAEEAAGGGGGLPLPPAAVVGQFIVVSAVDESGKVTATEAATLAGSGENADQSEERIEDIEIVATEGKFAKWISGEASGGGESSVNWAAHSQFIPVVAGETLRISCRSANACPGIVFYSTNTMAAANGVGYALDNPGTGDPNTGSINRYTYTDEDVIVPDGASYAILNHADGTGYTWKCQKVTVVSGGNNLADVIRYTEQTLADEQKAQARKNIGAISMDDLLTDDGEIVEDIKIVATEGKFAKWITGEATGGGESSVSWAEHSQFIPVTPGEILRISCKAATTACPGVVFYSTNTMSASYGIGYALENIEVSRTYYTDEDVVVPNGAAYAILNNADANANWKCQRVSASASLPGLGGISDKAEYEIKQLERRLTNAEKYNDFTWGTFDKAYFVFVHDDSREFITTAYNAFHAKGVPVSAAAIAPYLSNIHDGKTVKEWLDLIVADGGEVLCHYSYNLLDSDDDSIWYRYIVDAKREFENNGFNVRGLILAAQSDVGSVKGEKFCRRYFDYADKVGTSTRYNLGRKGMWTFASLDSFKERIDMCAQTPGIYAFGFHGNRDDETWITEDSLKEVIDYISAKGNCEITTYSAVFDAIGTTVLEKRIAALEAK